MRPSLSTSRLLASRGRRLAAASLTLALLVGGIDGASATPRPPTPPTPVTITSEHDVVAAQSARDAVAAEVGRLTAQIAQMENQLQILEGKKELAEQKYAYAQSELQKAKQHQQVTNDRFVQCQRDAAASRVAFVDSIRANYESGDVGGMAGAVLAADDPSALLEHGTLEGYLADHKADAVGKYQAVLVSCANDKAAAQRAVIATQKAATAAQNARVAAFAAVAQAQREEQSVEASKAATQQELDQKQASLFTTQAARQKYLNYRAAYRTYQNNLAAYNAWKAEQARLAAARARARARARHNGGGGGGSSDGGGWSSGPAAPSGGSWTADKARRAVARARSQLGVPYAWAGGGVSGPSWGVCDGSNGAPNDCNVRGFDCSGLAMYAWGQGWAHYAATQYTQAGSYHPSLGNLRPGDLLFWSYGGVSEIHHVAIYIGNGQIIQAPESGSYVMVSSMYAPGPIFGATRPLT